MANAREIQSRIKSIKDTRKITNAMYLISSTKLKKSRKLLADTEPYFYTLQGVIRRILRHMEVTEHPFFDMREETKLKKSRKLLADTEPYFYTLQGVIRRILRHMEVTEHPFFDMREEIPNGQRSRGLVVITGDKGLAGAYNHNILKLAGEWMEESGNNHLYVVGELGRQYFSARHIPIEDKGLAGAYNHNILKLAGEWMEESGNNHLYVVGELGRQYFSARHIPIEEQFHYTVQNPSMHRARMIASRVLQDFMDKRLDEVWVIYTEMVNSMKMEARTEQLLPLKKEDFGSLVIPADTHQEEIQMVPSPEAVLDHVVPNYVTGFVFGALVESFCSEQNSRMMAMQSASDNGAKLLNELAVEYNRVRQAAITQEITEVIGGARSQRKKR